MKKNITLLKLFLLKRAIAKGMKDFSWSENDLYDEDDDEYVERTEEQEQEMFEIAKKSLNSGKYTITDFELNKEDKKITCDFWIKEIQGQFTLYSEDKQDWIVYSI